MLLSNSNHTNIQSHILVYKLIYYDLVMSLYGRQVDTERGFYCLEQWEGCQTRYR